MPKTAAVSETHFSVSISYFSISVSHFSFLVPTFSGAQEIGLLGFV